MENCCVAERRISIGTWYVPNGQTAAQCTYCQYCINNGCISIDSVYKIGKQSKKL